MAQYKELVYMCLDEIKIHSDDSDITEEHIIFLLDKYRSALLKKMYLNTGIAIPTSNEQTICLPLIQVPAIADIPCVGDTYLRSSFKIPNLLGLGQPKVYAEDFFTNNITFVSKERLAYVGNNKYLKSFVYCAIGPDNYLYFKSSNPQFFYLENIKFTGIFEDSKEAAKLQCDNVSDNSSAGKKDCQPCSIMDMDFPIEEGLIPDLIQAVIKEILGAAYRPKDAVNDANDALSDLASYIAKNVKSNLAKQINS